MIWVEGMTATYWPAWGAFLGQYERACQMCPEEGAGILRAADWTNGGTTAGAGRRAQRRRWAALSERWISSWICRSPAWPTYASVALAASFGGSV